MAWQRNELLRDCYEIATRSSAARIDAHFSVLSIIGAQLSLQGEYVIKNLLKSAT